MPSSSTTQRCGREPPGQHRHPDRVVDAQPTPGVRQQHDAVHQRRALVVRPRLGDPVRRRSWKSTTRSVSAIAPADQATTRGGRCGATWNRCSTRTSTPTWPPATTSAGDRLQQAVGSRPGAGRPPAAPAGARRRRSAAGSSPIRCRCCSSTSRTTAQRVGRVPARAAAAARRRAGRRRTPRAARGRAARGTAAAARPAQPRARARRARTRGPARARPASARAAPGSPSVPQQRVAARRRRPRAPASPR